MVKILHDKYLRTQFMKTKWHVVLGIIAACTAGLLAIVLHNRLPVPPWRPSPSEITSSALTEMLVRAEMAARAGLVPETIQELPVRKNYANATKDGWGTPIRFAVTTDPISKSVVFKVQSAGIDQAFDTADDQSDQTVVRDPKQR